MTRAGVLLISHGTVDDLDDLPAFLANIRRGHPAPPELIAEVRRRYEAIGGRSPLHAICDELAAKLAARLRRSVVACARLWKPSAAEALLALPERVAVVPLAQHSAPIYAAAVRAVAGRRALACAANWGQEPRLTEAYANALRVTLADIPNEDRRHTTVVMTAHSLPVAVVRAGDPYEAEVRASAAAIARALGPDAPPHGVAFQSQGFGGGEWLGPDLKSALDDARARGDRRVVVAPIGFLADHVEILYDLDIEARAWAQERGLVLTRTPSLNASPAMLDVLEAVARPLLTSLEGG